MRLEALPRYRLAQVPTPLQRARNLEAALGHLAPRVYLKRDDLTGLAFGGNKVRKLEFLLADALAQGATTLISEGAVQSNHARATAAAAAVAGLRSVLILDARNGAEVAGNHLLASLMGAEIRIYPDPAARAAAMARIADELSERGEKPYVIPTGGSVPLGAVGYVLATRELLSQLSEIGESPGRLYLATGSFGTQAGLMVGARAFAAPFSVMGVAVSPVDDGKAAAGSALANETAALLDLDHRFTPEDVTVVGGFHGDRYGVPTSAGMAAIRLLARTEAVFLDPVYTAKAMSALLAHIAQEQFSPDDAVVFLHTGGGPSVFTITPEAGSPVAT